MTYFEGFIVPVPEANKTAYREHATSMGPMVQAIGVRRMVECWDSDVPEGKVTDFRKAVDATPEEKIVFSWFEYPNRQARDAANEKFMSDPQMEEMASQPMPFDGKRMIMGGFDAIVEEGSGGGGYVDGIVVPVNEAKRDAYRDMAAKNAKIFREYGATRIVETLADDVAHGKVTDFYRAVKAEDGETVAFSFIEWPDKATRDQAWGKIMEDKRMEHGGDAMAGQRMFWGGFEKIIDTAGRPAGQAQAAPLSA
jgi:uncharacterized protein YbaA (DUF1428 family)